MRIYNHRFFVISFVLLGLLVIFNPLEIMPGANSRLIYLHGTLVWAAIVLFPLAGLWHGWIENRQRETTQ